MSRGPTSLRVLSLIVDIRARSGSGGSGSSLDFTDSARDGVAASGSLEKGIGGTLLWCSSMPELSQ